MLDFCANEQWTYDRYRPINLMMLPIMQLPLRLKSSILELKRGLSSISFLGLHVLWCPELFTMFDELFASYLREGDVPERLVELNEASWRVCILN